MTMFSPPLYFSLCLNGGGGKRGIKLFPRAAQTLELADRHDMRREAAETLDGRRELCGKLNRDKCSPPKKN